VQHPRTRSAALRITARSTDAGAEGGLGLQSPQLHPHRRHREPKSLHHSLSAFGPNSNPNLNRLSAHGLEEDVGSDAMSLQVRVRCLLERDHHCQEPSVAGSDDKSTRGMPRNTSLTTWSLTMGSCSDTTLLDVANTYSQMVAGEVVVVALSSLHWLTQMLRLGTRWRVQGSVITAPSTRRGSMDVHHGHVHESDTTASSTRRGSMDLHQVTLTHPHA
jgi:hypothetical protein